MRNSILLVAAGTSAIIALLSSGLSANIQEAVGRSRPLPVHKVRASTLPMQGGVWKIERRIVTGAAE